jgi:ATP-dependent DNA helicase RecG
LGVGFADDREGCLFTTTVHRKEIAGAVERIGLSEATGISSGEILIALRQNGRITIPELALLIGVTERSIERNIRQLQGDGILRRVGPEKGGHWEVIEKIER